MTGLQSPKIRQIKTNEENSISFFSWLGEREPLNDLVLIEATYRRCNPRQSLSPRQLFSTQHTDTPQAYGVRWRSKVASSSHMCIHTPLVEAL
jgi:hypothetical protein